MYVISSRSPQTGKQRSLPLPVEPLQTSAKILIPTKSGGQNDTMKIFNSRLDGCYTLFNSSSKKSQQL